MLEHERYDLPVTARHPTHETVGRWSNYLNVVADNGALSLSCIVYGQPRFDEFGDVRVLLEATLGVDVTERLAVTNTFRSRYDSRPPDGIEDLDTMLLTGIVLELQ